MGDRALHRLQQLAGGTAESGRRRDYRCRLDHHRRRAGAYHHRTCRRIPRARSAAGASAISMAGSGRSETRPARRAGCRTRRRQQGACGAPQWFGRRGWNVRCDRLRRLRGGLHHPSRHSRPGNLALILSTGKGGVRGLASTFGIIFGDRMFGVTDYAAPSWWPHPSRHSRAGQSRADPLDRQGWSPRAGLHLRHHLRRPVLMWLAVAASALLKAYPTAFHLVQWLGPPT